MDMNKKISILIVDDVPENLRLLSVMLEQTGYLVRPATSAKLALAAARREPPSLILLDIRMPEMDGLELCRQLKVDEALKEIPVIFISALNETEEKIKAFQSGGVDYITKPFQEREVLARVTTHLELRRQKVELEIINRRLRELESLRDSLTHMIVHDMRGPLMLIQGHLQMIQAFDATTLCKDSRHGLAEAQAGAKRLTRMIAEMLLISKLEAGKLMIQSASCNLADLARKVAADLISVDNLKQNKINITSFPESVTVPLDVELIERVLQNLVGNAIKFSPEAGIVTLNIMMSANSEVRVEVIDAGPGIAPKFHRQIFEKFGQVESGRNRQGTGLGLTFCKLAVEAHGGQIGVNSTPKAGSTFWFTLKSNQRECAECGA